MQDNRTIQLIARGLLVLLWLSMFVVGIFWVTGTELPFDPGSVTFLLGLVSTALTVLVNLYDKSLRAEEYSTAHALADGYFFNFLEPALTRLITRHGEDFRFYVYIPEEFSELGKHGIERTLARLRSADYSSEVINLELEEGRARDLLTITGRDGNRYFDFPNTLMTLRNLVDFKAGERGKGFNERLWHEKSLEYIEQFRQRLLLQLGKSHLSQHVTLTDRKLAELIEE